MYNIVHKMNNTLFGKGKEKILECFCRNRSKEMYFSEILRETKLTQNTTLKHLENLRKNNLIISTKKIGNTFYRINRANPQIYSILSFFDYQRFNGLPIERKRTIQEFLDRLRVKPLVALVFGSTAAGTYDRDSDIDMLLVYNKKEVRERALAKDIAATTGVSIQTFIIDFEYLKEQILKKEDKVIAHAVKTGFILTGHDRFYREVLNE